MFFHYRNSGLDTSLSKEILTLEIVFSGVYMSSIHLPTLAFLNLGPWEIALILFLALLLFGGKKLPGLAKDLGQGIREFRRSLSAPSDDEIALAQSDSLPERNESYHEGATLNEKPARSSKKAAKKSTYKKKSSK